jgi:hypothetical protein
LGGFLVLQIRFAGLELGPLGCLLFLVVGSLAVILLPLLECGLLSVALLLPLLQLQPALPDAIKVGLALLIPAAKSRSRRGGEGGRGGKRGVKPAIQAQTECVLALLPELQLLPALSDLLRAMLSKSPAMN